MKFRTTDTPECHECPPLWMRVGLKIDDAYKVGSLVTFMRVSSSHDFGNNVRMPLIWSWSSLTVELESSSFSLMQDWKMYHILQLCRRIRKHIWCTLPRRTRSVDKSGTNFFFFIFYSSSLFNIWSIGCCFSCWWLSLKRWRPSNKRRIGLIVALPLLCSLHLSLYTSSVDIYRWLTVASLHVYISLRQKLLFAILLNHVCRLDDDEPHPSCSTADCITDEDMRTWTNRSSRDARPHAPSTDNFESVHFVRTSVSEEKEFRKNTQFGKTGTSK